MMNKFGKKLNEFLEFYNISVKEFAERIGTSPKNLNDILKGNIELSQNMISSENLSYNVTTVNLYLISRLILQDCFKYSILGGLTISPSL